MIFKQRGQRRRIELRLVQIGDVDAERVERFFGEILLAQADERHVESCGIEARNHPREQPLHAVHARPFPSEVIADLQNANLVHEARRLPLTAYAFTDNSRRDADGGGTLGDRFADDGAGADDGVGANVDAVQYLRARAKPRAVADGDAGRFARLLEHRTRGIAEVVIAADQVAVRGDQRVAPDPHAARRENLAIEADVGAIGQLDVAVLAREDRVPADEHAAPDADAGVRRLPSRRSGSCRRSRRCRRCESCADDAARRSARRRRCARTSRAAADTGFCRSASPSAPGTLCDSSTTISCLSSAPSRACRRSARRICRGRTRPAERARPAHAESGSQPPAFLVPRQRFPDAVAKADLRRVADLGARAADVERAALGEEVHSAPVYRRLDAERHAHGLARGAGQPERPHGQLQRSAAPRPLQRQSVPSTR